MNKTAAGHRYWIAFIVLSGWFLSSANAGAGAVIKPEDLLAIDDTIREEIGFHNLPGAVVMVGDANGVIYRAAVGNRAVQPAPLPMLPDTIFDIASLTKPIATATAILQLAEQRLLDLDTAVAHYWPEFAANGKGDITVRQLLTHYSGLRADLDMRTRWSGYDTAMQMIEAERPRTPPGSQFTYSDINYAALGELVHRISYEPLNLYASRRIFEPLGMKDTRFLPDPALRTRIAPTEDSLHGVVHDPMARRMDGIAGHAGVFSTIDDLARFSRMLLNRGTLDGVQILKPESVELMSTAQSPEGKTIQRSLGWDLNSPYAVSQGGTQFQSGSFSHTGYTGTALWIDPKSGVFVILLSNRVHPYGRGNIQPLRLKVASIVAYALAPDSLVAQTQTGPYGPVVRDYLKQ